VSPHPPFSRNGNVYGMSAGDYSALMPAKLDHLGPLLGFVGDELARASAGESASTRTTPNWPSFALTLGSGESSIDLFVEPLDNFQAACFLGSADPLPKRSPRSQGTKSPTVGMSGNARRARSRWFTASARSLPVRTYSIEDGQGCRTSPAPCPPRRVGQCWRGGPDKARGPG